MRLSFFALVAVCLFVPSDARAQEILTEPICFKLRSEAPYKTYGSFITDYYTAEDGTRARHRSNFRLEPLGTKDPVTGELMDQAEFCSYGPFFPDRKLELVLRTLVPIFSCKTKVDQGEILIKGFQKPDEPGTKTYAECFD